MEHAAVVVEESAIVSIDRVSRPRRWAYECRYLVACRLHNAPKTNRLRAQRKMTTMSTQSDIQKTINQTVERVISQAMENTSALPKEIQEQTAQFALADAANRLGFGLNLQGYGQSWNGQGYGVGSTQHNK